MCADSAARVACGQAAGDCRQRRLRLGTAWARYDVRSATLEASHISQHADYDVHRAAVLAWLRPDDAPVHLSMQASLDDDQLLAGSVPQPPDWLRAWRAARTPQSWEAASQQFATEHFIRQSRDRSVGSRPLKNMARIMREVIRQAKREALRRSTAITLSFDDRAGYKLVRYRAEALTSHASSGPAASQDGASTAPPAASQGEERGALLPPVASQERPVATEGLLGCIQCLRGSTLEELADDYAERASKEVLALLEHFCTPLGDDSKDTALYDHIVANVRAIVADGALQKVAKMLRCTAMTSIQLIARDPAHLIRIACKEPLVRTGRFEAQQTQLFTGKHALLKDVQYSDEVPLQAPEPCLISDVARGLDRLETGGGGEAQQTQLFIGKHALLKDIQYSDAVQARLEACQRVVLAHRGEQGGGVKHVMRQRAVDLHRGSVEDAGSTGQRCSRPSPKPPKNSAGAPAWRAFTNKR